MAMDDIQPCPRQVIGPLRERHAIDSSMVTGSDVGDHLEEVRQVAHTAHSLHKLRPSMVAGSKAEAFHFGLVAVIFLGNDVAVIQIVPENHFPSGHVKLSPHRKYSCL